MSHSQDGPAGPSGPSQSLSNPAPMEPVPPNNQQTWSRPNTLPEIQPVSERRGAEDLSQSPPEQPLEQRRDQPEYHINQEMLRHCRHMEHAIELAAQATPKHTNFCVGALIVDAVTDQVLVTGYTGEVHDALWVNTHAEESALIKLAAQRGVHPIRLLGETMENPVLVYTTMEPCMRRLSGNLSCVKRILDLRRADGTSVVHAVVVGVYEPDTFVSRNEGRQLLRDAGVRLVRVTGYEERILEIATAGHLKPEKVIFNPDPEGREIPKENEPKEYKDVNVKILDDGNLTFPSRAMNNTHPGN